MSNLRDDRRVSWPIDAHHTLRIAISRLDHANEAGLRRKVLATYSDALGLSDVA